MEIHNQDIVSNNVQVLKKAVAMSLALRLTTSNSTRKSNHMSK